ncbi:MAG: GNAT family N-acetyltransferase [Azospirillum brasilense]|nr:MAG: GNAT family N-acetyltransferase [Azospirillum brasilense]
MQLLTPRTRLRRWRAEDRPAFFALNAEPEVRRHLLPLTRPESDAMLDRIDQHFAEHGWGAWAVEERASGQLIGLCGLAHVRWEAPFTPAVEIAWRFTASRHGQGLAREAAERVLDAGFGPLGLERIVAFTVPANTASWGLMERLGMKRTGSFSHPRLEPGHPLHHHLLYEIRAGERRRG